MLRPAIFLDRDGVINRYVYNAEFGTVDSPSSPEEFTLVSDAGKAIAKLNALGLLVIVVSNQPGIAKGRFTASLLEKMTAKMEAGIAADGGQLDGIYYCLHHPQATLPEYAAICDCRKPRPGLLQQAAREHGIDLPRSFMIGDGITDIQAGQAAGTRTIFIGQSKPYILDAFEEHKVKPDYLLPSLLEAAGLMERLAQTEWPSGGGALDASAVVRER
jgi:D,D-heptose 1,7-bisphosphate phosphatase